MGSKAQNKLISQEICALQGRTVKRRIVHAIIPHSIDVKNVLAFFILVQFLRFSTFLSILPIKTLHK